MPSTRPRWLGGKTAIEIGEELAMNIAAPAAWRILAPISVRTEGASAHSTMLTMKTSSPAR